MFVVFLLSPNAAKCGPEKLQTRALLRQWWFLNDNVFLFKLTEKSYAGLCLISFKYLLNKFTIIIFCTRKYSYLAIVIFQAEEHRLLSICNHLWQLFGSSFRSNQSEVFSNDVLKNFTKKTHLCQSLFFSMKSATLSTVVLSCEFYKIFKNTSFIEYHWWLFLLLLSIFLFLTSSTTYSEVTSETASNFFVYRIFFEMQIL